MAEEIFQLISSTEGTLLATPLSQLPRKSYFLDDFEIKQADLLRPGRPILFQSALTYIAPHRRFFTTMKGSVGLGPRSIQPGDSICVLSGGQVPMILRKDDDHNHLVGES